MLRGASSRSTPTARQRLDKVETWDIDVTNWIDVELTVAVFQHWIDEANAARSVKTEPATDGRD